MRRYRVVIILLTITVMAVVGYPVSAGQDDVYYTQNTGAQYPQNTQQDNAQHKTFGIDFEGFIKTASGILSGIIVITGFCVAVFKSVRNAVIKYIRKALDIVDANKKIDDKFIEISKQVADDIEARNRQYTIMSGQNEEISESLDALLRAIDDIQRRLRNGEDCNQAIVRDNITKTYYKYCRKRSIPIHERENMSKMFDIYTNVYNGNSYVSDLMADVNTWEVHGEGCGVGMFAGN